MDNLEFLIIDLFKKGLNDLLEMDRSLIDLGISEQCICARLAFHLENRLRNYDKENSSSIFTGYYVDVEFNKMFGNSPKNVYYDDTGHSVRCALLIHSRGLESQDNLLWLEMKKESNKFQNESDRKRVQSVTKREAGNEDFVNNTLLGIYLTLNKSSFNVEYYENEEFWKNECIDF